MKNLNIMLKPDSSLCNLNCKYCFYADVSSKRSQAFYGVMTKETVLDILKNIEKELDDGDKIQFTFQGGEPMLAGLEYFEFFVTTVKKWDKKINVFYALQTNATLLDEKWCEFLKENNFLVGVSLDLPAEEHNSARVDKNGNGTYKEVALKIQLLKKYKVEFNILCTLTNFVARYPQKVWKTLCELDIEYVQFTPCLGDLGCDVNSLYALTPKRFAAFYTTLFSLWFEDYKKGKYRSIKFFDDAVNLLVYGRPTCCGMNGSCQSQLVIEGDGSAYPCDFYCIDEYKLGNLRESGFSELLNSQKVKDFINRPHTRPALCNSCKYNYYCGGNCKRMQKEICCGKDDTYCGYQDFLNNCGQELLNIAKEQRHFISRNS